jgi:hypothetical protein
MTNIDYGYKFKRQIEFRGRTIDDVKTVYGYYRHVYIPNGLSDGIAYNVHKIYDPVTRLEYDVEPLTVQVFIEFDEDGKKVFDYVLE